MTQTAKNNPVNYKGRFARGKWPLFEAVIFDIDNVLVDTRRSYMEAIRWTIDIYLTEGNIPLFVRDLKQRNPNLLSPADINNFKLLGGFNDDWDCCYGILVYLLSLRVKKRRLSELKKIINIKKLCERVKKRPLGVSGIVKLFGRSSPVKIEKIARIFQEVYLGKDLFKAIEKRNPVYWKKRGLIKRERLIFKKRLLEKLKAAQLQLGITTGRPYYEAMHALRAFDIEGLFDAVTTINDVRKAEQQLKQPLRKPHPFSIIETAKKIGNHKRFLYIGDLPDDVMAANQAKHELNIYSVAFPTYSADPSASLAEIQKTQPDFIIQKPSDLFSIIKT
ncbi:MAG: HAD hydrolase-like protein [Candidatus Omnitrophica bacterium]|nr:HAD hydrolase-like protein [Candidatus Omnitrophota bacterium]MDD5672481.1 HAD hydrolase-like protein [Candidatus Omnitrophota bacterium]